MSEELVGFRQVDMTPFRQKMSSQDRRQMIAEKFPSTQHMDWDKAFENDMDLLGHLLRDILKLDMAIPGQAGRRPGLDEKEATPAFDRLLGRDYCDRPYSLLPFAKTMALLADSRTLRSLEVKVGISKSRLHRLLQGKQQPELAEMEKIAKIFDKAPSFFVEYRALVVRNAINSHMAAAEPEVTVRVYEQLWHAKLE